MFHKYKAKAIYYDLKKKVIINHKDNNNPFLIRFDSQLELNTFIQLKKVFNDVLIHQKIEIFPNKFWRVDFQIQHKNNTFFVESKGFITREFKLQLEILKHYNKNTFDSILFVTSNLETLKQLKRLQTTALMFNDFLSTLHLIKKELDSNDTLL